MIDGIYEVGTTERDTRNLIVEIINRINKALGHETPTIYKRYSDFGQVPKYIVNIAGFTHIESGYCFYYNKYFGPKYRWQAEESLLLNKIFGVAKVDVYGEPYYGLDEKDVENIKDIMKYSDEEFSLMIRLT